MRWASPPSSTSALMERVDRLAGRTLAEVADVLGATVPADLSRDKGFIGTLLEAALGASASNRPVPDFEALGIELKSLPMDANGRVRESTFVCTAPMDGEVATSFQESRVHHKLSAVLWMPVIGGGPVSERVIGQGLLWRPTDEEAEQLQSDWQQLTDLLVLGDHDAIHARLGSVLQLRPKAAHSGSLRWALGEDGDWVQTGPRGFYLRASFTSSIIAARLRGM